MKDSALFFLVLTACAGFFLDADLYPEDLPQATMNTFYTHDLPYNDNQNIQVCKLTSGTLPNGVSVTKNCTLLGTPLESGSFEFEVTLMETASSVSSGDLDCLFEYLGEDETSEDPSCDDTQDSDDDHSTNIKTETDVETYTLLVE